MIKEYLYKNYKPRQLVGGYTELAKSSELVNLLFFENL